MLNETKGYSQAFCISCENGYKTVEVKDFEFTQGKEVRDCKEAFLVKSDPVKEVELNYSTSNDRVEISEGLETYMKNKNVADYPHCVVDSCKVVDEKDVESENVEVNSFYNVKAKKNVVKGYKETLRLECKVKNNTLSIFSSNFNVIQKEKVTIETRIFEIK